MQVQGWQVAPHWASPARRDLRSTDGEQIRAQYLAPEEASWSAQVGVAVTPEGTSVGHLPLVHTGVHTAPGTPWMETFFSSDSPV